MSLTLVAGECRVTVPVPHTRSSELLSFLDPEYEVPLPEFIECRLRDVPCILAYIHVHSQLLDTATPGMKAGMCKTCMPSMRGRGDLSEALRMLKIVQFLDVTPAVDMMLHFVHHTVARCGSVDDLLVCMFSSDMLDSLALVDRREMYEVLLSNLSLGGVPGGPGG
jgi:hypothetical protein